MSYQNNPFLKAKMLKEQQKKVEAAALLAEQNRSDAENIALQQASYLNAITSERKDTHSMQKQYHW